MKNKDDEGALPCPASELGLRAMEIAGERVNPWLGALEAFSPEEAQRMHRELCVHQIELEVQNEELRRIQAELEQSRTRYFDLYDLAPVGYCTVSRDGVILEANLAAARLLGVDRDALICQSLFDHIYTKDRDIYYLHSRCSFETGKPQTCELQMVRPDASTCWVRLDGVVAQEGDGEPVCRVVLSDITERRGREDAREQTTRVIALASTPGDLRAQMSELLASLQRWAGCEAVGIRLRDGDDYSYFETRGFPASFVECETQLCAYDAHGKLLRDASGKPVLECMCGKVLGGRIDPGQPFFTPHGSFWTNNTSHLLASTTPADRLARTRNRCNQAGYESVALIPLRADDQMLGLLQFNDHRPDRFTPDLIARFERMADSLALVLLRRRTEEALQRSEARYLAIIEDQTELVCRFRPDGRLSFVNESYARCYGKTRQELLDRNYIPNIPAADIAMIQERLGRLSPAAPLASFEHRVIMPGGSICWQHWTHRGIYSPEGSLVETQAVGRDITERKLAEESLRQLNEQLESRVAERTAELEKACDELRRRNVQFRALAAELAQTESRERRRIAQLLHDDLQQLLVAAKFKTEIILSELREPGLKAAARQVQEVHDQAIAASRSLTLELAPPILHDAGLTAGLRWLAQWMSEQHKLSVDVSGAAPPVPPPEDLCLLLFQAVRELLFNVVKHAGVREVRVVLEATHDGLRVTVSDGGKGFDAARVQAMPRSFGLFSIQERLAQVEGRLEIVSAPGCGTKVDLYVPLTGVSENRRVAG